MTPTARRPKLLVVDDQPINIQTLFSIFEADHEVCMATQGERALQICQEQQPDLVLLDIMMPGMDGHEVCRRLQADARTQHIPVIFVTAQSDPAEETKGLQIGAVDFITKPVNASVVRARVGAHLLLRNSIEQVRELNATLEQRVAQRTQELQTALEQLRASQESLASSEARATISTLVASVSHEMGTPLGNSLMATSTMSARTQEFSQRVESGQLTRTHLKEYIETVSHGTQLVENSLQRANDLLGDLRQVAADQASEQRRVFDLATAVREVVNTLTPSLRRQPHRLILDLAPGIAMDSLPGPLGQVVINLVNNAYLHGFEGRADGVMTICSVQEGKEVLLTFEDNGCGITPEVLEKMFMPFFSTKIGRGGTGLGMAIVQNLVAKSLRGSVQAKSTVGVGTCIEVRLPLVLP